MQLKSEDYHKEHNVGVEEEFIHAVFGTGVALENGFTATHAVGVIQTGDAFHGRGHMEHTAANAEYISYLTTNEVFRMQNDLPIRFKSILQPGGTAEVPEEVNIFLGCMENMDTATEFQAGGVGMRLLCGDIFGFFTPEAGNGTLNDVNWFCITGHNDLEQVDEMIATNPNNLSGQNWCVLDSSGDGIPYEFVAEWEPTNVVPGVGGVAPTIINAEVNYYINGIHVCKHMQRGTYQITMATAELMNFGVVSMNGAASSDASQPAYWMEYMKCEQKRYRSW